MKRYAQAQVQKDIEPILTEVPTPASALWTTLGCWSRASVKGALEELVAAGRAKRTTEVYRGGGTPYRHLYARAT